MEELKKAAEMASHIGIHRKVDGTFGAGGGSGWGKMALKGGPSSRPTRSRTRRIGDPKYQIYVTPKRYGLFNHDSNYLHIVLHGWSELRYALESDDEGPVEEQEVAKEVMVELLMPALPMTRARTSPVGSWRLWKSRKAFGE